MFKYTICFVIALSAFISAAPREATAQMTPERFIKKFDADKDGNVSKEEYTGRRRPFSFFDADGNDIATGDEINAALGGVASKLKQKPMLDGQVPPDTIDARTRCGLGRFKHDCSIKVAIEKGLFETGLKPKFPDGLGCRRIDEAWAISYSAKRDQEQYHGGIDMPAPFGTPMLAAADGTVVSKTADPMSYRGIELILRHSPEETGLPVWTYTQYAHFNEPPTVNVGDRVRMGQNLGPTGNSGFQKSQGSRSRPRRPAIHFAVWFSDKPGFAADHNRIIPVDGWWMDPNAMYRLKPPFDSASLKALPDAEKDVAIPVMLESGETVPANTKLIWPYACRR
ncbi:peptidoglycan DD-metalloendopeptidase family protein [Thalassospiraceae bacterium LMO-JJ14]|nr:peptidoglycan DD-metalloendopeptidase family protein [Thalassospiraceae bacterium LMO-JJ14]